MLAREAADGGTPTAGAALITGLIGIVKVRTAGPLQQVAGGRRLIAELPGRAGQQRTGQQAVVAPDPRIGSECGISHRCADPQASIWRTFDLVEAETIDVH